MFKIKWQDMYHRFAPYILPFIVLVLMATFFMGSSPLYQTNPWDDTNAMLTMGRSIQHGLIPFVDIVEQRGPFIYSLYAIAAGISNTSFFGVFIVELINLTLIYYFATRLARVFTPNMHRVPWLALLAPLTLLATPAFRVGGSPEEFAFTSVMYLLVVLTENQGRFATIKLPQFFWLGLNLGIIFWNKFSLVGTFTIFFLLCGFYLLFRREWFRFVKVVAVSILGFFVASLPFLIYYIAVGHLNTLFDIYLIQNLTSYHTETLSLTDQCIQIMQLVKKQMHTYFYAGVLMFLSWAWAWRKGQHVMIEILLAGGSIIFVALQRVVFVYYPLVWFPFIAIAVIRLGAYLWEWLSNKTEWSFKIMGPIFITLLCLSFPFLNNPDLKRLVPINATKSLNGITNSAPPKFGAIMQAKYRNPTLLTLNTIDAGFFLYSKSVPVTPYYHRMNMSYKQLPIMYDTFANAMNHQSVDYAVVRLRHSVSANASKAYLQTAGVNAVDNSLKSALDKNYHVVATASNAPSLTYVLFERNSAK